MPVTDNEILLNSIMAKPLQKNAGLYITVKRYFTDINGTVIDKNSAGVPASCKTYYPFWMFGQFDRAGGYRVGNQVTPRDKATPYVGTFVYGLDMPFLFATGLNNLKNNLLTGDIIHIFTDSLDVPSIYIYIVQSCPASSLASIYSNAIASEKEKIEIYGLNYFSVTIAGGITTPNFQFATNINLTKMDVLGAYKNTPYDPLSYDQTNYYQYNFIVLPIRFTVDQYQEISSSIPFQTDSILFSFLLKKNAKALYELKNTTDLMSNLFTEFQKSIV